MSKDKLILKDNTIIELEKNSSLNNVMVVFDSKDKMILIWSKFTEDNLKKVQIKSCDDIVISNYNDLVLESETSIIEKNGTILTRFNLREKTEIEILRNELEEIKEGLQTQDGALCELGETISTIMEGREN